MANILDGKQLSAQMKAEAQVRLALLAKHHVTVNLTVVLVGDDPASATYVRSKERMASDIGMVGDVVRLPASISLDDLLATIDGLNADDDVDGILVQLPLPSHLPEQTVLERVSPVKDVDGFHPLTVGRNMAGADGVWPCTPRGILYMLKKTGMAVSGKHAVVIGRSQIVGRPMAHLLLKQDATVTICHSKTTHLEQFTRMADILVVAAGRPKMITADYVKPGAIVIDVGINRVDGKVVGDVDFDSVSQVAGWITPVPGGVGRMTVATLMHNTIDLAVQRRGLEGDL
jgi:methylenetetrahydrofolate dehydrogenase (NADP+) / methenyltetrahydrofolate cyclohydrolase